MSDEPNKAHVDSAKVRPRGTEPISTARLDLRPFKARDAEALMSWTNDSESRKYLLGQELKDEEAARGKIGRWRVRYGDPDFLVWCVQEAEGKKAIGKVSASLEKHLSAAEIEYVISPEARGKGYASEAVRAVVAYLHDIGVHRVYARVHVDNVASMKVMASAEMEWEGLLRDALVDRNGRFYDVSIYSHVDNARRHLR